MANVKLSIIAPSGAVVPLASNVGEPGPYRVLFGTTGFGIPKATVSTTESAGDGRRIGNVRVSGRIVTLAVDVTGTSRADTEAKLNTLADAISYADGKPLPRLRATYPNGTAREVEFLHIGGGEEGFVDDELSVSLILTLDCPDPYWTSVEYTSFVVQQTNPEVGFLESLPNAYLLPSDAFGQIVVNNPGRVDSWIDWELQGPFTRVDVTNASGRGWEFEADVDEGETIFIRKTPAGIEVVDQTGATRFASIGDVPQFFRIPAGQSQFTVAVQGANAATKAIGRYKPRHRLVF